MGGRNTIANLVRVLLALTLSLAAPAVFSILQVFQSAASSPNREKKKKTDDKNIYLQPEPWHPVNHQAKIKRSHFGSQSKYKEGVRRAMRGGEARRCTADEDG